MIKGIKKSINKCNNTPKFPIYLNHLNKKSACRINTKHKDSTKINKPFPKQSSWACSPPCEAASKTFAINAVISL